MATITRGTQTVFTDERVFSHSLGRYLTRLTSVGIVRFRAWLSVFSTRLRKWVNHYTHLARSAVPSLTSFVCLYLHRVRLWRTTAIQRLTVSLAAFRMALMGVLALMAMSSISHAAIPDTERAVLQALYAGTNGDTWTNKTNWNGAPGTECTWFGVTCNAAESHVVQINLPFNNLIGSLPATLNQLTALEGFRVNVNRLTGSIPSLTGLTELVFFIANFNRLTGSIPSLAGLTALREFFVINNQLTGSIPSLAGLTALREFLVINNQLTGSIPSLAGLTALREFDVGANELTGAIPSLTGLTALELFSVNNNQLTGSIPSLTGLAALELFSVNGNQLTGSIPALTGLIALQNFFVAGNQLTGPIPAVPSPPALSDEGSQLCPNQLTVSTDTSWDAATLGATWDVGCIAVLQQQVLTFNPAPLLFVGGTGTVAVTVTPNPGSSAPVVFSSLTPSVCSVDVASGRVTVRPAAIVGEVCTIAADKANDATINSAVQVQQSITIERAVATFTVTPSRITGDGVISPDTVQTITSGSTATFTITPNVGFNIAGVNGSCGGVLTGNSFTTNAITADCTVIASFALIPVATGELAIPTLSEWMLILLAVALVMIAQLGTGPRKTSGRT
jgi:hypothetical protein